MPPISLSPDQVASVIYLVILIIAIIGYGFFSASGKVPFGKVVQASLVWLCVFIGMIAGYALWQDVSQTLLPRQAVFAEGSIVEVPKARDGHFYLTLDVNGSPISFVVDTGATNMVLGPRDAARAGLRADDLVFSGWASTANGTVQTARVSLDSVALGGITEHDLPAVVNGAELDTSLLGMEYLSRWDEVTIGADKMILRR